MKKATFKAQLYLGVVIVLIGLICSTVFKLGIFANIGWVIYGLLFAINPVSSTQWKHVPKIGLYVRLGGFVVIFLGLITHFGV